MPFESEPIGPAVLEPPKTKVSKNTKTDKKHKLARRWKIILFNDDVTEIVYVIFVIYTVFKYDQEKCFQITAAANEKGSEICFVGSKELCELRLEQVNDLNKQYNQQLKMEMEPEE